METRSKIIIGTCAGICGVLIAGTLVLKMAFGTKLNIDPEVKVEVGDPVVLEVSNFTKAMSPEDMAKVNISSRLMKDDKKFTFNPSTKEVKSRKKNYLEVGTYEVTLKSGNKEVTSKLIVQDTKGPEITEKGSNHRTPVGTVDFDYTSLVDIEDYSKFDVDITTSSVDLNREGSYPVVFLAKDEYGNKSELEVILNVGEGNYTTTINPEEDTNNDQGIWSNGNENQNTEEENNNTNWWTNNGSGWTNNNNTWSNNDNTNNWDTSEDEDDEDDNDTTTDWREEYHKKENGGSSNSEDNSKPAEFGKVDNKTFKDMDEANSWIKDNIEGKGNVSWTIENTDDGVKYNFKYN